MNVFQRNAKYIVVLAVVFGGTSGIFSKLVTVNALTLGFYRLLFALPMFVIPVLLNQREELKNISKKDMIWSIFSGIALAIHFFAWFNCVKYTSIASAVVLSALHPLVVVVITTLIFKKKVGVKAVVGIIIAILGGAIIAGFDYNISGTAILGDIIALIASLGKGIYFSIGEKVRKTLNSSIYVMLVFGVSFICFSAGMLLTKTPFLGFPKINWVWIIGATLFCQIGAHAVWNWTMGYVSSLYVSAWGTCEIVFATIYAFFVFGEIPSKWQVIGATIVIAGLLYYNYNSKRANNLSK